MSPANLTLALLTATFAFCGLAYGGQGVLFAEMVRALGMSTGAYGSAETIPPLVGFFCLVFGGPVLARIGKKAVALAGFLLFAAAALLLSVAGGLWTFVGALIVLGGGYGGIEMAMNSAALGWELAERRPAMNLLHAAFSAGAIAGASAVGLLLESGMLYPRILLGFSVVCAFAFTMMLPAPLHPADPPRAPAERSESDMRSALWLLVQHRPLRTLALIGMLGVVGEGVANNWAVIHLNSLGGTAIIGGGAYALFNATMLVGRLGNAALVARHGARLSLQISGALLVICGLLLLVDSLPVAIAAFALTGFAVAGVIPTVLSFAASHVPGREGEVTGAVMGAIYLAFAACSPLVGWMAEVVSLRLAMFVVSISGIAALLLVRRVELPGRG